MSSTPPGRCAVLGAGIVGLSAALELALRGHKVTVIADKFSPETTSDGAGAYWRPYFLLGSSDEDVAYVRRCCCVAAGPDCSYAP